MPNKSMTVHETEDVPFMTTEWKAAIRMKRRSAKKYNKNKTEKNLASMKKMAQQSHKSEENGHSELLEANIKRIKM